MVRGLDTDTSVGLRSTQMICREPFMTKLTALVIGLLFGSTSIAYAEDGQALYSSKCSVCHQAAGIGSPGQFPPLSGRVGKIASSPEGKAYLKDVLLNGLHGAIDVSDETYVGFMPSFNSLTDSQIAAVLTYVSSLNTPGKAPAFSEDEIKASRSTPKKAKEIVSERAALNAIHPLPEKLIFREPKLFSVTSH